MGISEVLGTNPKLKIGFIILVIISMIVYYTVIAPRSGFVDSSSLGAAVASRPPSGYDYITWTYDSPVAPKARAAINAL